MEQWVFVLPGADDQSECTFFANPSIAGYHVDDGTDIQLTVTFRDEKGDHVYDVVLTKTARKNWYASETYDIAARAWKKDYKVQAEITQKDGTAETEELSREEVTAAWPTFKEKTVKLEKDSDGQLQKEISLNQWIQEEMTSPLFEYKVEDQAGCEIILDTQKQCVSINNAESKGEFTLAIVDPAGNEEVTEMSIIAVAGTEKGLGIGIVALAVIVVAVIAVLLLKKKTGSVGATAKTTKILAAREEVDKYCKRLELLTRKTENTMHEIRMAAQAAEERIRQDGEASAYDVDDIRTMTEEAENLFKEPCCENIHTMRVIMGAVSQNLLKMQGNASIKVDSGSHSGMENPKNYLDSAKRQDILSKIEVDAVSVENLCAEMSTILNTLKEIAYREEVPFEKDISITVTDGHGEYETRRACKEAYGAMASGVFSLDTLKFLSKNEVWMTLPEIIGQKTDIRIFAIDDNRMRAIAEKPILIWQGKNQRILEFTYDEDVVFRLRDHAYAEIKLHFER